MGSSEYLLNRIHKHNRVVDKFDALSLSQEINQSLTGIYEFLSFYSLFSTKPYEGPIVRVCNGISCILEGSENLYSHLKKISEKGLKEGRKFNLEKTSCLGACFKPPAILINEEIFLGVKPKDVKELVLNLKKEEPLEIPILNSQNKLLLRNVYEIDPLNIEDYIQRGGYEALRKSLSMNKDSIIEEVKKSNLRGRGGAGFPTGLKWEFVKNQREKEKYVICNADEGEPGTFKDRLLLENDPHAVIEGMIIAGYAVNAEKGFIYLRGEYKRAYEILEEALKQAKEFGFLGENIMDSNYSFEIEIIRGGGGYICGEETALIESIEGKRGEPRKKPPYPAEKGLFEKPTLVNNVETFACIPLIIEKGGEFFREKGSILLSLSGDFLKRGVCEIPLGTPLNRVIEEFAEGIKGEKLKFLILGGVSGYTLRNIDNSLALDYDSLWRKNLSFGSGAMIAVGKNRCSVKLAKSIMNFFKEESCGRCIPCLVGTHESWEILNRISQGEGRYEDLEKLEEISEVMELTSFCPLGQTATRVIMGILKEFKDEWLTHINKKTCPFRMCP